MASLFSRQQLAGIWGLLVLIVLVSWGLALEEGSGGAARWASPILMFLAYFKVRLIGLHFMELNRAPLFLRAILEAWAAAAVLGILAFYYGLFPL